MPAYKPPTQFPGLDRLPAGIRGLVEGVFPQSPEMPTPIGTALAGGIPGAIKSAAGLGGSAQDMLNPQSLATMQRMGDEVKGMIQRGLVQMPTRGPDLRGFPPPAGSHPAIQSLKDLLQKTTEKASRARTGALVPMTSK